MDNQQRRRWQVKDTIFSPWQDLPGRYTVTEISGMRRQGCFAAAMPNDEADQSASNSESRLSQQSQN
jgi:hypothetical protein